MASDQATTISYKKKIKQNYCTYTKIRIRIKDKTMVRIQIKIDRIHNSVLEIAKSLKLHCIQRRLFILSLKGQSHETFDPRVFSPIKSH
jgi:hypothetical protein